MTQIINLRFCLGGGASSHFSAESGLGNWKCIHAFLWFPYYGFLWCSMVPILLFPYDVPMVSYVFYMIFFGSLCLVHGFHVAFCGCLCWSLASYDVL